MTATDFTYMWERIPIIIPSLHPDEKFLRLLDALYHETEQKPTIVIVDDGSGAAYTEIFEKSKERFHCHLLTFPENQGKGRALKAAFQYILQHFPDSLGVVTADGDGQHAVKDIFSCMRKLSEYPDHFVLGCRSFDDGEVPIKNRFGNRLTRKVLRYTKGMNVSDTQTGLRAIPLSFLKTLIEVPGERYEYEMNMLLACGEHHIPILEVPIKTIYLEGNKDSHFHPVFDSLKIYAVFLRYLLSALLSFGLDIAIFSVSIILLKELFPAQYILYSTVLARSCSSLFNYLANKHLVFQSRSEKRPALKYYTLAVLQMAASAYLVTYIYFLLPQASETFIKILVDTFLFFLSFYIQRNWVFNSTNSY
jgi:glycosyltransferase involved in cell wall biosynthesis